MEVLIKWVNGKLTLKSYDVAYPKLPMSVDFTKDTQEHVIRLFLLFLNKIGRWAL